MKIKQILITVISILCIHISLFAGETESNRPQNQELRPPKIIITENDRMKLDMGLSGLKPNFFFINKKYDYKKVEFLFKIKDSKAYYWYIKFLKERKTLLGSIEKVQHYAIMCVREFNVFLQKSKRNRDKIAAILRTREDTQWMKKWKKEQRYRRLNEKFKDKKLILFGFNMDLNLLFSGAGYRKVLHSLDIGIAGSFGIGFLWFFSNPMKDFDMGLGLNVSYRVESESNEGDICYTQHYIDIEPNLTFKLKLVTYYSLIFSVGPEMKFLLSSNNDEQAYKTVLGLSLKLGAMILLKNCNFAIIPCLSIKIMKVRTACDDHRTNKTDLYIGGNVRLLFNLN